MFKKMIIICLVVASQCNVFLSVNAAQSSIRANFDANISAFSNIQNGSYWTNGTTPPPSQQAEWTNTSPNMEAMAQDTRGFAKFTLTGKERVSVQMETWTDYIHDFDTDKTIMEVKLNSQYEDSQIEFFASAPATGGAWITNAGLFTLNYGGTTPFEIMRDVNSSPLRVCDASYTRADYKSDYAEKWHHYYLVLDKNKYDIYDNGVKINTIPINTTLSNSNHKATRFINRFQRWGGGILYLDDYEMKPFGALSLEYSTISDGAEEIPLYQTRHILDFNTLIDEASLNAVKVYKGTTDITAATQISLDNVDKTKVIVKFQADLDVYSTYKIQYGGLTDIFGQTAVAGQSISFSTIEDAPVKLLASTPANGAINVDPLANTLTADFNFALNANTVKAENITILPAVSLKNIELTNYGTRLTITPASDFLANTQYTVTFNDAIKSTTGMSIESGSNSFSFTTAHTAGQYADNLTTLTVRPSGLYKLEGGFSKNTDTAALENEIKSQTGLSDITRWSLGPYAEGAMIFYLPDGIRDFAFDMFDIARSSNGKGKASVWQSDDGVNFTQIDVIPETLTTMDWSVLNVGGNPSDDHGYAYLQRYAGKTSENARYVKLTITNNLANSPVAGGSWSSTWTPRITTASLNTQTPGISLLSAIPENSSDTSLPTNFAEFSFETILYGESITADNITLSPATVKGVSVSPNYRKLTIELEEPTIPGTLYNLNMSGVKDIWGRAINPSYSFTPGNMYLYLSATAMLNGNTPRFTITNYENEPKTAALVAAVYDDLNTLISVVADEVEIPSFGTYNLTINDKTLTITNAVTQYVKFFAFESFSTIKPLPRKLITTVDKEFWPGFTRKAVTLSYDDGPQNSDIVMMSKLDSKGFRATFNLNSDKFASLNASTLASYTTAYSKHEVANHSKGHPQLANLSLTAALAAVNDGHTELETIFGNGSIRGFAYPYDRPYNSPNDTPIIARLGELGEVYARPSSVSGTFDIPVNFMEWQFTCHHKDLAQFKDEFYALSDNSLKLLSVWGHSWEFSADSSATPPRQESWTTILYPFIDELDARRNEIYVGTNIEIYDYIQAKNNLEVTESSVYNPSGVAVYVKINDIKYIVPAGERIYI